MLDQKQNQNQKAGDNSILTQNNITINPFDEEIYKKLLNSVLNIGLYPLKESVEIIKQRLDNFTRILKDLGTKEKNLRDRIDKIQL